MEKRVKILAVALLAVMVLLCVGTTVVPHQAFAVSAGGQELQGYQPQDIIQSDVNIDSTDGNALAGKLESMLLTLVRFIIPILAVACVAMIVYHSVRNMFVKKPEDRVKIGGLLKNMFIGFFWILCAWIVVEVIVFGVTGGASILTTILYA